jgi:chromosome segregation ATPase
MQINLTPTNMDANQIAMLVAMMAADPKGTQERLAQLNEIKDKIEADYADLQKKIAEYEAIKKSVESSKETLEVNRRMFSEDRAALNLAKASFEEEARTFRMEIEARQRRLDDLIAQNTEALKTAREAERKARDLQEVAERTVAGAVKKEQQAAEMVAKLKQIIE